MKRVPLNIKDYTKNASNKFSYGRLIIYLFISLTLTVLLLITIIQSDYQGVPLVFSSFALILITCYTIMNVAALVKKIKK